VTAHEGLVNAGRALADLERAVSSLRRVFGDSLDMRRVTDDVARLATSLAVLTENAPPPVAGPASPDLEVIPDAEYDPAFWRDAEDEGLGASDRHAP
jgi:hypothetical protein